MTIEQKCNERIKYFNTISKHKYVILLPIENIENWTWTLSNDSGLCVFKIYPEQEEMYKILQLIKDVDMTECLTSRSIFIRECRIYLESNSVSETYNFIKKQRNKNIIAFFRRISHRVII